MNTKRAKPGPILCLLSVLLLVSACNWPDSYRSAGGPRSTAPQAAPTARPVHLATATLTPLPAVVLSNTVEQRGRFALHLPPGYHALEGIDGGVFVYPAPDGAAGAWPGFLAFYPVPGSADETLVSLLNATPHARDVEPPLEVDIGGRTFAGLFLETDGGDRLFLAAAEGWALVVQGPAGRWPALAAGLNQVLTSLSFEEENR